MLKIIKITPDLIIEAKSLLPLDYIKSLEKKKDFNESIIARYYIFKKSNFLPKIDNSGKPIFENKNFWSISHKKNIVFIGTNDSPIGVDIEVIKQRGNEVFSLNKEDEYKLFGEKNFENFYKLWTIKESIIKLHLVGIDDLEQIKIDKIEKKETTIDGIKFEFKILGKFKNKDFVSYSGFENNLVYAVSYFL